MILLHEYVLCCLSHCIRTFPLFCISSCDEQETQIKSMQKTIDKANSETKNKISMTMANHEAAGSVRVGYHVMLMLMLMLVLLVCNRGGVCLRLCLCHTTCV